VLKRISILKKNRNDQVRVLLSPSLELSFLESAFLTFLFLFLKVRTSNDFILLSSKKRTNYLTSSIYQITKKKEKTGDIHAKKMSDILTCRFYLLITSNSLFTFNRLKYRITKWEEIF